MPLDAEVLLSRLQPMLARLVADLAQRTMDPGVVAALREEHAREVSARRTADPFEVWTDFRVTQIGAAWLLSLLFVRTLEDRGLVPLRLRDADHRDQLRALAPFLNDRDYLLLVFRELTRFHAVCSVFDADHNPVWTLGPSADSAQELLAFCRSPAGLGGLDFSGDTRFLGDVYERLDEGVQKRFALLQTPDFVEEFILDRTLAPALRERGVQGLSLIDPTCGSGHFLLGAFARLRRAWAETEPAAGAETWAFRALDQVYGVDINPYAVAIARFRLVLAYLEAAGCEELGAARDLRLNVAVADSLLPVEGAKQQSLAGLEQDAGARGRWGVNPFAFSQSPEAQRVLGGRKFDVVVGNPPYITVKDKALRDVYREKYASASGKYQLVVPFVERFFGLGEPEGWVGAIVGNGFMKRNFGRKLIEEFLPKVDLTQVVDSSGAFIPGHGTPTVMLFGRHRRASKETVLAVMGKRGEPTTPEIPAQGLVWRSIRDHHEEEGYDDDYISVEEVERIQIASHPWTLRGGGALRLVAAIDENAASSLGNVAEVGIFGMTNADDCMVVPKGVAARTDIESDMVCGLVIGECVRDWAALDSTDSIYPYHWPAGLVKPDDRPALMRFLWSFRTTLRERATFGGGTYHSDGLPWWKWHQVTSTRIETPLTITFAFVATHNHFVLDRGGRVFNRTAPIIKLPPEATEEDHLALLGYLNSSTACFWMKQVMFSKGAGGIGGGYHTETWSRRMEFDGTKMKAVPVPSLADRNLVELGRRMDRLGSQLVAISYTSALADDYEDALELRSQLRLLRRSRDALRSTMRVGQEEIDWYIYNSLGLTSLEQAVQNWEEFEFQLGMRPCDILLARAVESGKAQKTDWFSRHGGTPITSLDDLPPKYREIASQRLEAIRSTKAVRLIEQPEYKRRWSFVDERTAQAAALRTWLLDHIESTLSTSPDPTPRTTRQLARDLQQDPKLRAVAEVYTDSVDPDLESLFTDLIAFDAVPFVAPLRYKPPGLKKHRAWQRTWEAQRQEDAWEDADPATRGPRPQVPLPPKYKSADFSKPTTWRLRGKLDVPKERFISYPGLTDADDASPVLGWSGWDHADRMAALAQLVERHGGDPERLKPMLAGMYELLPWVQQWHGDDMRYGTPLGELWAGHLEGLRMSAGLSMDEIEGWKPPRKTRARGRKPGKPRKPPPDRAALVAALEALLRNPAVGVTRKALAAHLGCTQPAAGKAAKPLLDDGTWKLVKQRPITYAPGDA